MSSSKTITTPTNGSTACIPNRIEQQQLKSELIDHYFCSMILVTIFPFASSPLLLVGFRCHITLVIGILTNKAIKKSESNHCINFIALQYNDQDTKALSYYLESYSATCATINCSTLLDFTAQLPRSWIKVVQREHINSPRLKIDHSGFSF